MTAKEFYLLGDAKASPLSIEVDSSQDFAALQELLAAHFAVVQPKGIDLSVDSELLTGVDEVLSATKPVAISIDGKEIREPPGPQGLPTVGNYYEIFPDHLGNHQRLFDRYGKIFKETNNGKTWYQTNDPELAAIAFSESDFFSKQINDDHPLSSAKDQQAGVFLSDTSSPAWKVTHKFLPPALGPKAVRHYAPQMNAEINHAFNVFDELDERDEAWNAYQYMMKLGSGAVGKLVLGMDFKHFDSVDAPFHKMVADIAELLSLMKKLSATSSWVAHLPFGDGRKLRSISAEINGMITESVEKNRSGGEDLELQDAALKANNVVDYVARAVDSKGERLPAEYMTSSLAVISGAGFTTSSSLLSWLLYGLCTYPGMQERLLQELIDHGIDDQTDITADMIEELDFLGKYVKETQRRHNPAFQPARTALCDVILPGGYRIPKGGVVVPALHHIHNNPDIWDNPTEFDPDRWDSERVRNRHKSSYIPFAQGPRSCIGFNFALLEVKIFLAKLVYRYKFQKYGDAAVQYDPMFALIRPDNLYVRAQRRVKWPPRSSPPPPAAAAN